jgi:protein-tyrosine phosphatase
MARDRTTVVRVHDNTRDLGGLPVPGVGSIRPGRVWRGAAHDRSLPVLAESLPVHFFDLRRSTEVAAEGKGSGHRHHWPVADPAGHRTPPGQRDDDHYVETSLALLPVLGGCLTDLCTTIATAADPVFVGCRLGKDRTGFVVLLLCTLLGVTREAIVADYVRTGESYRGSPEWVGAYAAARNEDPAEVLRRLSPGEDIPRRILDRIPPDQDSLRNELGIGRELLRHTVEAVVY